MNTRLTLLLIAIPAFAVAQTQPRTPLQHQAQSQPAISSPGSDVVQKVCHAEEITSGPEYEQLKRIERALGSVLARDKSHHIYIALIKSDTLNAGAVNLSQTDAMVCVHLGLARFMGSAEGELAFTLSHEIGHTLDMECLTATGRSRIANGSISMGTVLANIIRGKNTIEAGRIAVTKTCESRADEIGFYLFTQAGYNPFDAGGAFGRLQMASGEQEGGILPTLRAMASDHPMTSERIAHMRSILMAFTQGKGK